MSRKRTTGTTPGETVRTLRELQGLTQGELARQTGVPQTAISAIENGRSAIGVVRGVRLSRVLGVHPSVIVFAGYGETWG